MRNFLKLTSSKRAAVFFGVLQLIVCALQYSEATELKYINLSIVNSSVALNFSSDVDLYQIAHQQNDSPVAAVRIVCPIGSSLSMGKDDLVSQILKDEGGLPFSLIGSVRKTEAKSDSLFLYKTNLRVQMNEENKREYDKQQLINGASYKSAFTEMIHSQNELQCWAKAVVFFGKHYIIKPMMVPTKNLARILG